ETAKAGKQPTPLLRFVGNPRKHMPKGLPFEFKYYVELVDLTGRCIREDKRGFITDAQPILARLNIQPENWLKLTTKFTKVFKGSVGRPDAKQKYCEHLKLKRRGNLTQCSELLA
ncbi:hypothetical protein N473_26355, partial [Pseudoalteromonas luteoviolacea CPMOR-1]